MRSQLVVATLAYLRARGVDPAPLVARFGLPGEVERAREAVLPLDVLGAFLDAAAESACDPLLGVHVACAVDRGAFGVLAFGARLSPTVRAALARLARHIRLSNDTVEVTFEESARGGAIRQRVAGEPRALGRHANEFFVAILLEEGRRLLGGALSPARVWVAHERGDVDLAAALDVARVEFGAGENGLAFTPDVLAQSLAADPALLSYLDAQAEAELAQLGDAKELVGALRHTLREDLPAGRATLAHSARRLALSRRTLQRRLEEAGTSYQQVVDDARAELARTLVGEGAQPVARIAALLGYADEDAFARAFKRWTGFTPAGYRTRG